MDGKRNDEPPEPAEEYSDEELLKEFEACLLYTSKHLG